MGSTNPVGRSPTHFNYYEIGKATVAWVALMVLSVGVMKGIERYAQRTITPLQRNIGGVLLTSVYLVIAARLFGPFTKKIDPPSLGLKSSSSTTVADRHGSGFEVEVRDEDVSVDHNKLGADGLGVVGAPHDRPLISPAFDVVPLLSPQQYFSPLVGLSPVDPSLPRLVDLTRVDPMQLLFALESFRDSILNRDSLFVECNVHLQGRVIVVRADTSTHKKKLEALHGCDLLRALIMGGRRQAIGFAQQAIVGLAHSEVRRQKALLRVEASRPATHLEDEDLVLVESPGCADRERPKDLPRPSVEGILHLKNPKEQIQRIYNYYKGDLKKSEQVVALRDLLLGCYRNHPKHHRLVLAICKKLLEKKLIPFSGNPFHEFWSPLIFEVKELRKGLSYIRGGKKTQFTLTDLFYLRQLNTNGQNQCLTHCFLEDLGQKKEQWDKVLRIKKLAQILISSKHAKSSNFNNNFEHNMLFAVLMSSGLSKGSINWLFKRNDQAEFLGEVLDFFELHEFLRPIGGLKNLKKGMLKRAAATYVQKGHCFAEVLRKLKDVHLLTDSETVNYFFDAENCDTELDIFTIDREYPSLFEVDITPNFMMNVLRNTLSILEAEKVRTGREYLTSDSQANTLIRLLTNGFFSHSKQSQCVVFILNHFLAECPDYFVYQLFDGHPDSKVFLSSHYDLFKNCVKMNMKEVWPNLHREFKEGLLSEVFDIIAQLESDHDLGLLDRILQSIILPMLQYEGSLLELTKGYSDDDQFNANLRKMQFHQEQV